ncbi:helix-turn-helix domain-containing protein [Streptomyces sp. NPDC057596]|uniref:helix-turn-helix domain-containing protein n=1 Tax=unclassified Streptomyces TaxID=2593676 RepID=UPI003437B3A1
MEHNEGSPPTLVVARRVRELRERRGFTAQALADKLSEQGVPWERSTVAKLENGKRQNLTLTEWLALSVVLNVAPIHLLVPLDDDSEFQVTPRVRVPALRVRQFIRGEAPLPDADARAFYSEVPEREFEDLMGTEDAQARLQHQRILGLTGFNSDGTRKRRDDE